MVDTRSTSARRRPSERPWLVLLALMTGSCGPVSPNVASPVDGFQPREGSRPVFVITDDALGAGGYTDIEDGFAVTWLLGSGCCRVVGVAATFGNVPEAVARAALANLLAHQGYTGPLWPGPARPHADERGRTPPETLAALAAAIAAEPELTVVSLGPLTLVADLLDAHGEGGFAPGGGVVLMAGALTAPGNVPPDFRVEYNLAFDPEGANRAWPALTGATLVPLDATDAWTIDAAWWSEHGPGSRLAPFADQIETWITLSDPATGGRGFWLFDAGATIVGLAPPTGTRTSHEPICIDARGGLYQGSGPACVPMRVVWSAPPAAVRAAMAAALR